LRLVILSSLVKTSCDVDLFEKRRDDKDQNEAGKNVGKPGRAPDVEDFERAENFKDSEEDKANAEWSPSSKIFALARVLEKAERYESCDNTKEYSG